MRRVFFPGLFAALLGLLFLADCRHEKENPFQNAVPGKAQYVGMETCRSCHEDIYKTFIRTGMGQSWAPATRKKSAADFSPGKALVYDSVRNFYYKPYWDHDSLCIEEYRLQGTDTIHKRIEKVSYIVGSGQHTNSHLIDINGYLHQAPITFYTQKHTWDLAPGFEKGVNSRFDRKIEPECITCHNGYPDFVNTSLNKYTRIPSGIDCERCHGPGSLHVADKLKGHLTDTSKTPDYTIVNPRKLPMDAQNNLCQRCHLQGIAVLNDGKTFFDFLPSHELKQSMQVFMPQYSGADRNMIMASHVERMKRSRCYLESGHMSCITCHNPHISVQETPLAQYTQACASCHGQRDSCTEFFVVRMDKQNNCIACHMVRNGSIDIPHVAVTDHYIRRRPDLQNTSGKPRFKGMTCYNNNHPDARTRARAFLEFYERYLSSPALLDSAAYYLHKEGVDTSADADADLIRVLFLREDWKRVARLSASLQHATMKDAWTAYRIGESLVKNHEVTRGILFLQQAVSIKPLALDFQNKLGLAYIEQNEWEKAKLVFEKVIQEYPKNAVAQAQRGYIAMKEGQLPAARTFLETSVALNPDQLQPLINLAVVYHAQQLPSSRIRPLLEHARELDPANQQVGAMLQDLQK